MSLTQTLIFVVTMLILFSGLFYTIRVFRRDLSAAAPANSRGRGARRDASPGRRI